MKATPRLSRQLALSVLLFAFGAHAVAPWMTGESQAEDLAITLVTFSPGDDVPEWWGHTALVVQDKRLNQTRLYNYGMFSFDQFFDKFVMGRLEFWVSEEMGPVRTFEFYKSRLNRDVRMQELDLTPTQAMKVAQLLGENVLPENRNYLYQHYTDNCSTRPRDILDAALGGQLKEATKGPARMGLRQHTLRYSYVNPPMSLVLDYLQNDLLDFPITQQDEAYLPDELERQVQNLVVTRDDGTKVPLVKKQWNYFKSNRVPPPEVPPNWNLQLALIGLLIAGVGHALGHLGRDGARWARVLLGLYTLVIGAVSGLLGTTLFLMGLFTNHQVTHRNENLFLMNPLNLCLVLFGLLLLFGAKRATRLLLGTWTLLALLNAVGIAVKVLPAFNQDNWNLILLITPVNFGFAALYWLDRRYQRNRRTNA